MFAASLLICCAALAHLQNLTDTRNRQVWIQLLNCICGCELILSNSTRLYFFLGRVFNQPNLNPSHCPLKAACNFPFIATSRSWMLNKEFRFFSC
jgi:hypothetical protein